MKKSENGFSIVHVLLVILVVGVIGSVGWFIYNHNKKTSHSTGSNSQGANAEVTDQIYSTAQSGGNATRDIQVIGFYKKSLKVRAVSIEYGKDQKHFTSADGGLVSVLKELGGTPYYVWELTNLAPDTTYYYHVGATVTDSQGNDKVLFSAIKSFKSLK